MKGEESSLLIIISCMKFIKEVEYLNQQPVTSEAQQKVIFSARDFDIIQYLGGYVIRKLYYKIKDNSDNSIIDGSILAACKNEDTQDQALVTCLSRGGLKRKQEMKKILVI